MEALEGSTLAGQRATRRGALGPLHVSHTFAAGSSHAELLDGLTGAPQPDAPGVTIHSLQLNADEVGAPKLPWSESDFDEFGRPLGLDGSPWRLAWNRAGGEVRCYNRDLRVGLFITAGPVASWEFSSPLLPFWHWAAAAQGAAMVHGGTIGTCEAMGIVGGPSGTGKSTTVLLGMREGLRSCGDDYVWLQPDDSGTQVWAVFRTIKTLAGSPLVPPMSERVREEGEIRKQIHWVPDGELLSQATLRLVWVLREPGANNRPPTRIDALTALLPSTLLRVNGDHATVADVLQRVVTTLEVRPLPRDGDFDAVMRTLMHDCADSGVRA